MQKLIFLVIGGSAGTLARYALTAAITSRAGLGFPFGTLAVNMLGCFLVGFLDVLAERKLHMVPQMRIMFVTGFCGAFTTFSAFILESYSLMREGEMLQALANIFGSVGLGLIMFRLGLWLAEGL
jgi:fluoride exporter